MCLYGHEGPRHFPIKHAHKFTGLLWFQKPPAPGRIVPFPTHLNGSSFATFSQNPRFRVLENSSKTGGREGEGLVPSHGQPHSALCIVSCCCYKRTRWIYIFLALERDRKNQEHEMWSTTLSFAKHHGTTFSQSDHTWGGETGARIHVINMSTNY